MRLWKRLFKRSSQPIEESADLDQKLSSDKQDKVSDRSNRLICSKCGSETYFPESTPSYGTALVCSECKASFLPIGNPTERPYCLPKEVESFFGYKACSLLHLRCVWCREINYSVVVPERGCNVPWYSNQQQNNTQAAFVLNITCKHCNKLFVVEWDQDLFVENALPELNYFEKSAPEVDEPMALISASEEGNDEIVKMLLENGAKVNLQLDNGGCALMMASQKGHEGIVKMFLENGAKVDLQMYDGWTALMFASGQGHEVIVKMLLGKGATVDLQLDNGGTALFAASEKGHEGIVRMLLENGAKVDLQMDDGETAVTAASSRGHHRIVKILLESGADVSEKDLWVALRMASRDGDTVVVKMLLAKGANVNRQDNIGATVLMLASQNGHKGVVKMLLEEGADVNLQTERGYTALSLTKSGSISRLLKTAGAK